MRPGGVDMENNDAVRAGQHRAKIKRRIERLARAMALAFVAVWLLAPASAQAQRASSFIRGDLLVGKFRSQADLDRMSTEDQRNTLIVELTGRTANDVHFYQGLNDFDLAGAGALLVFLRETGARNDADLKRMTADDMRNTAIVIIAAQTGRPGPQLQAMNNIQLTQLVLGPERAWIRGVLLTGRFRTQEQLNTMSGEDQRNTLIVELVNRTANDVRFYQGLNDADLAGAGALLVYLRGTGSRSDADLKTMTADGMRNTVIVEVHAQTRRADLQSLSNIQLARIVLGSPGEVRDPSTLPEPQRPGTHTVVLRVNRWFTNNSMRAFSDVPFIGTFIGRGTDCRHGFTLPQTAAGAGSGFTGVAGWGQVEGDGHPGAGSDQCISWVDRLGFDFDTSPFTSIPGEKSLQRVVLAYGEQVAPACAVLTYTQGGFLADSMPCWTAGDARPEAKPAGCLVVRIPNLDWIAHPPTNAPVPDTGATFPRLGPQAWDVTTLFQARWQPPFNPAPTGVGYMLTGSPVHTRNLDANDNTRCTSLVSDVRLEVRYVVPPLTPQYDPAPLR